MICPLLSERAGTQTADPACCSHPTLAVQALATGFCDVMTWVQKAVTEGKPGRATEPSTSRSGYRNPRRR